MAHNLFYFLSIVFIGIFTFKSTNFQQEISLVKLKAVGGYSSDIDESDSSSESSSESSSQEEDSEYSGYTKSSNGEKPIDNSKYFAAKEGISNGNNYYEEFVGEGILSFSSFSNLVKFLLFESKFRKLNASFLDCKTVAEAYLNSRFIPNASESQIIVKYLDLLQLLRRYIRTGGSCINAFCVKEKAKRDSASSSSSSKTEKDIDSGDESSSNSDLETKSRASSSSDSHSAISLPSSLAPSKEVLNRHFSGGSIVFLPLKTKHYNSNVQQINSKVSEEEIPDFDPNFAQGLNSESNSEIDTQTENANDSLPTEDPLLVSYEQEQLDEEQEPTNSEDVSEETVISSLDLRSKSSISITEVEMEINLEDPWRSIISMILYEPVRRSSLVYDETHCDKITKSTGRIIAFLTNANCKLRFALGDYNKKKCKGRNRVSSLLHGCYSLRKKIKHYISIYSKFRYDLVDSMVAVTQCSLAKNNYLTNSNQIFSQFHEAGPFSRCTIKEYYFSLDFYIFLSYIINAYNSAKEKLEQFINNSCTTLCPTSCRKKPRICNCLEDSFNNIFADRINMESYKLNLGKKISFCKNYLISNYLFSNNIPESAEYVSTSGKRYLIEQFEHVQTIQFPKVYSSNPEKLTLLKSNLFNVILNPTSVREQSQQYTSSKEGSIKSATIKKPSKFNNLFKTRKNKNKNNVDSSANTNSQAIPKTPPNPQNNWL